MASLSSETFNYGVRAFERFVHHYDDYDIRTSAALYAKDPDTTRYDMPSVYLQTYLDQWLLTGGGVEWSGNNHTTWVRLVVATADAVMRGSVACDYYGPKPPDRDPERGYSRPIVAIYEDGSRGEDFLDPDYYAVAAYRWSHRGSGLLQCTDYFEPPGIALDPMSTDE